MDNDIKQTPYEMTTRVSPDDSSPERADYGYEIKPGTATDDQDMHRLGKKQQLSRQFHAISIFGLTSVVMFTWQAILSTAIFSLINGSRGGSVYSFLVTWLLTIPVVASMAEMASMAPTSGGQYHWVSEFAPPKYQRVLSYISGWLCALGWQAFIANASFAVGQSIFILASLYHPDFVQQPWHGTLMTLAIATVAVSFNIFAARRIPIFEGIVLVFHIVGFFAVMIPLWVLAPKVPSSQVWGKEAFANYGGWPTMGAAVVVGQLAASASLVGADSAAHMSEEVKNASVTVPRMMFGTILFNGLTGFISILTYCYVIQDLEVQILGSTAVYPWIEVFTVATGSKAGVVCMAVCITVAAFGSTINVIAAGSRQAWSFARDDGLPFPKWFMKITVIDKVPLPLNAMMACMGILIILALLNLGGSEVFNSIIGLMNGAVGSTYALSIGCVLWRRLFGEPLPHARWSLGRWGVPINMLAFAYQTFTTIISFFPIFAATTAADMNWGIAMFGLALVIGIVSFIFHGRKKYRGPVVDIKRE